MATFQKYFMPIKYLKKRLLKFDPQNPLDTDNTPVNSIQGDTLDFIAYIQGAIDGDLITLPSNSGQGTTSLSFYDAGEGFWVKGDTGITVTKTANGEYTLSIPENKAIVSLHKRLTDESSELNGSGSLLLTVDYNTTDFHTSNTNAQFPTVSFIWNNGEQYEPQATGNVSAIGITATNSTPSSGASLLTLTNVSGAIDPLELTLKLIF
jgi:hypothetical protein